MTRNRLEKTVAGVEDQGVRQEAGVVAGSNAGVGHVQKVVGVVQVR